MTYFSLLTEMQEKAICQIVFRMTFSALDLKKHFTKTQYFGSKANNPTGSSCLGLFGTFCPYLLNRIGLEIWMPLLEEIIKNIAHPSCIGYYIYRTY